MTMETTIWWQGWASPFPASYIPEVPTMDLLPEETNFCFKGLRWEGVQRDEKKRWPEKT